MKVYDMTHADKVIVEHPICPPLLARMGTGGNQVPMVLTQNQVGEIRCSETVAPTLTGQANASARNHPLVLMDQGDNNGNANEANARTLLRILRKEVGAQAFTEWRLRVLDSLQQAEVLRSKVYGESVRAEAKEKGPELDDGSLSRTEDLQARTLRDLWERGPNRSTPQGLELAKQLTGELGEGLSRMSHEDSPEGAMGTSRVRKLTPIETERLQGFPDNYTRIPWKGKSAEECPDSPRYKAIGNSWCVPCVRWIGKRIQAELEKNK